ncbi:MAG: RHS repeat-associated core domain-containing protein [Microcystis panniformis]
MAFYNYLYDAASRITKITDIDGTTDYTYDKRAQLTGANYSNTNNPDESYSYDANGNRITSSIHGNGYVTGKGNRLLSDGKYNYEYDNEGNLTKQTEIATGKVQELTWDYRNRLVAFVDKDATGKETQRVEFTYDALNRRIAKAVDTNPQDTTPPVVRQFIYDGQNILLEFVDSDGAGANQPVLDTRYLHGAGVDQVLAQESAGNVEWHLTDHLGTVRDLVNNSGAVVNHFVYDSFGQVISESNPAIDTRYLFTGREFDKETGLQYNRARYYNQATGRFLSEDPIAFKSGDVNLYRYALNSPIKFNDPSGKTAIALVLPAALPIGWIVLGTVIIAGIIYYQAMPHESTSTADDTTTSNGCTPQEKYLLQQQVSRLCKGTESGSSCKPGMSSEEALANAAKFEACAAARDAINNRCFGGGDAGHREAANNARRAAQKCRDTAGQCKPK